MYSYLIIYFNRDSFCFLNFDWLYLMSYNNMMDWSSTISFIIKYKGGNITHPPTFMDCWRHHIGTHNNDIPICLMYRIYSLFIYYTFIGRYVENVELYMKYLWVVSQSRFIINGLLGLIHFFFGYRYYLRRLLFDL